MVIKPIIKQSALYQVKLDYKALFVYFTLGAKLNGGGRA